MIMVANRKMNAKLFKDLKMLEQTYLVTFDEKGNAESLQEESLTTLTRAAPWLPIFKNRDNIVKLFSELKIKNGNGSVSR